MRGSIQRKGKRYYVVLAINGKRKWFTGGTKKDAERVLAEKLAEINQGTYREIPKTTFKEFVEIWRKNHAELNVKPSTLAVYNHIINKRLLPEFENFLMTDISPTLLLNYVTKRKQADVKKKSIDKKTGKKHEETRNGIKGNDASKESVVKNAVQ